MNNDIAVSEREAQQPRSIKEIVDSLHRNFANLPDGPRYFNQFWTLLEDSDGRFRRPLIRREKLVKFLSMIELSTPVVVGDVDESHRALLADSLMCIAVKLAADNIELKGFLEPSVDKSVPGAAGEMSRLEQEIPAIRSIGVDLWELSQLLNINLSNKIGAKDLEEINKNILAKQNSLELDR